MGIKPSAQKQALERGRQIKQELQGRVSRKFKKLEEQISHINPFLKNKIKGSSALELVEMMDNHQTTPLEILLVFIERTATIGIRNNYVLDQMFQEGVIMAKECGQIRKNSPHKKSWKVGRNLAECFPPFFGVPVSLKQTILYKGRTTYIGHIYPINEILQKNYLFVQVILKMGFVPFVRSNVPPACKIADTTNNIFGYAQNGWKANRSCGGSSGGQGGLISCGCSPFGIGSDIGGSSRIPAEWCGLATVKHAFRYTTSGNAFFGKYSAGLPTKSQLSPISRSVEDLIVYFQFICNPQHYGEVNRMDRDIYLKQVPFRSQIINSGRKLTIGYYKNIKELFKTSAANARVVDECVDILRNLGHNLKQIEIPRLQDVFIQFGRGFLSDNTLQFLEELRQTEPYLKDYSNFYQLKATPAFLKTIIGWVMSKRQPRLSKILSMTEAQSAVDIVEAVSADMKLFEREIHEYLADQEIDVWISPGFPIPAIEHGTISNFTILMAQTICMNALHYPSGGVPVSIVRADELEFEDDFKDKITKSTKQSLKGAQGLPVGIQVSALPNHQEEILFIMKQIEQKVHFNRNHVCPTLLQM